MKDILQKENDIPFPEFCYQIDDNGPCAFMANREAYCEECVILQLKQLRKYLRFLRKENKK